MPASGVYDFLVIGAGMAGAGAAFELAAKASVIILEGESVAGYHTTGRSAALFSATYGNAAVRALTAASRAFFDSPPAGFTPRPLLAPQGLMVIGRPGQRAKIEARAREFQERLDNVEVIDGAGARARVAILKSAYVDAAVFEPNASRIDVDALHQGYLRGFKDRGGRLITGARVTALARDGDNWRIETANDAFRASVVVNAAGAWCDEIAALAGAGVLGLEPRRRTIAVFDPPAGAGPDAWPAVVDIDEEFYFMGDSGRILASPADETPSPPCDAQPEELDVALAIDRFEHVTDFKVAELTGKWAGLRTFAPDAALVIGFDAKTPGFFWLAGQGGYGIQTAPAASRVVAALARGGEIPADITAHGVGARELSPARFR